MDFENLFPGCVQGVGSVTEHKDGNVKLLAWIGDSGTWELTGYGQSLAPTLANTSTGKVESSKRGKVVKPAPVVDDLDLDDL